LAALVQYGAGESGVEVVPDIDMAGVDGLRPIAGDPAGPTVGEGTALIRRWETGHRRAGPGSRPCAGRRVRPKHRRNNGRHDRQYGDAESQQPHDAAYPSRWHTSIIPLLPRSRRRHERSPGQGADGRVEQPKRAPITRAGIPHAGIPEAGIARARNCPAPELRLRL
jgi:hypothetical protein